jgi:uncharacterized protein
MSTKSDQINKQLKGLTTTTPNLEAAAVIDNDGLLIASALPADTDEDSVSAMSAALLGISERISAELKRGEFELVFLRGDKGLTIITRAGQGAVLTVLADRSAKLGLVFLDVTRAATEIGRLLD